MSKGAYRAIHLQDDGTFTLAVEELTKTLGRDITSEVASAFGSTDYLSQEQVHILAMSCTWEERTAMVRRWDFFEERVRSLDSTERANQLIEGLPEDHLGGPVLDILFSIFKSARVQGEVDAWSRIKPQLDRMYLTHDDPEIDKMRELANSPFLQLLEAREGSQYEHPVVAAFRKLGYEQHATPRKVINRFPWTREALEFERRITTRGGINDANSTQD